MAYAHPLAFLLGLEGVALLRAGVDEPYDERFVLDRFDEIERMLRAPDGPRGAVGHEIGTASTRDCYDGWAADYDDPGNPLIQVEEPAVREILGRVPAGRALDVACGTGRHAAFLAERGHRVVGVDSSPPMLERARAKLPHATFLESDLRRLPFADARFDTLVCGLALVHQPELDRVLTEFARVLRPGGNAVVSDIHWLSLYVGGRLLVPAVAGGVDAVPAGRFRPSDYANAAVRAGLTIREMRELPWGRRPGHGGPDAETWCPGAAMAAYESLPAVVVLHLQRVSPITGRAATGAGYG